MNHATHKHQIRRLKRAHGQVAGVMRMIEDEKYCLDILSQLRAVRAALRKVEQGVLETHAQHCLKQAMAKGDPATLDLKLAELMHAMERFTR